MAGITLAQAQAQLDAWLAASLAVSQGQSYSIAGRTLNRSSAGEISQMIDKWQNMVNDLSRKNRGGGRTRYLVTAS